MHNQLRFLFFNVTFLVKAGNDVWCVNDMFTKPGKLVDLIGSLWSLLPGGEVEGVVVFSYQPQISSYPCINNPLPQRVAISSCQCS